MGCAETPTERKLSRKYFPIPFLFWVQNLGWYLKAEWETALENSSAVFILTLRISRWEWKHNLWFESAPLSRQCPFELKGLVYQDSASWLLGFWRLQCKSCPCPSTHRPTHGCVVCWARIVLAPATAFTACFDVEQQMTTVPWIFHQDRLQLERSRQVFGWLCLGFGGLSL